MDTLEVYQSSLIISSKLFPILEVHGADKATPRFLLAVSYFLLSTCSRFAHLFRNRYRRKMLLILFSRWHVTLSIEKRCVVVVGVLGVAIGMVIAIDSEPKGG